MDAEQGKNNAERLRKAGLKVTGPRLAILTALERDRSHPGAEHLHAALSADHPSISLSTVYSTLEAFVQAGLIRKVAAQDGRLRVDGTCEDHDHALCRRCGAIFDVERSCYPLPQAPRSLPQGLDVLGVRVEYEVICSACGEAEPMKQGTETAP